jgi:hypothetical protein
MVAIEVAPWFGMNLTATQSASTSRQLELTMNVSKCFKTPFNGAFGNKT